MIDRQFIERVWYGGDAFAAAARAVLIPAERAFGGVVGARDLLYDAGWLPARETAVPVVSVGNLTVGGTGKTPVSAWIARGLRSRGASPAVVMRGYGDDEPLVHETLNPSIPVIVDPDRAAGVAEAVRRGADVVVLDDAFQHRRVHRLADLVLVSADQWTPVVRLLPAGPWREPLRAVRRATLIIVTRKAAADDVVESVHERLADVAPAVPRVSVRLDPGDVVRAGGERESVSLDSLRGKSVRSVLSIADPASFVRQMDAHGIRVTASIFPDHHAFDRAEVDGIARRFAPDDMIVCTLKDVVKLAPYWPRLAPPLWYVSQQVMVERGVGGLERVLDDLVVSRSSSTSPTAG